MNPNIKINNIKTRQSCLLSTLLEKDTLTCLPS